ncbi:MAG: DNA repair protein RecN [Candidatus Cloacimonetes bacterium]|nr:DNA repair protein RecN [Candidatus Cloacimonadota bacterium]
MLQELIISNFVLIDEISLVFSPNLTVFTGETGAGKSIMLDALELLCGGKAEKNAFRDPLKPLKVQGLFRISKNSGLWAELEELGVSIEDEDENLILKRELSPQGKNRCFINSDMVRVQDLKKISGWLVNIHSQHETHSLLDPKSHPEFFYALGGQELNSLLVAYREKFEEFRSLWQKKQKMDARRREILREKDRLSLEVEEISSLNLVRGEEEELALRHKALVNAQEIGIKISNILSFMDGSSEGSLMYQLALMTRDIRSLAVLDPRSSELVDVLGQIELQFEELSSRLQDYEDVSRSGSDYDLDSVESRMAQIENIKRKYGADIEAVLELEKENAETIFSLMREEKELDSLDHLLPVKSRELYQDALALKALKEKARVRVENEVSQCLARLNMPEARLDIRFVNREGSLEFVLDQKTVALGPDGLESVEFYLKSNSGQQPSPLAKIASGGEISRVMLAFKKVFASVKTSQTLIFDEIDTGIGGDTAHRLAEIVQEISSLRQAVVITHLAQMALPANRHYRVDKIVEKSGTISKVVLLTASERKTELKRMLGLTSEDIPDETLNRMLQKFGKPILENERT